MTTNARAPRTSPDFAMSRKDRAQRDLPASARWTSLSRISQQAPYVYGRLHVAA